MSKNCQIMQRMKKNYETRSRTFLTRRTPVVIRLDGKAFHTYTKGLDKPFDEGLIEDMAETARFLCLEIQGAKLAYVQSDEISILLTDYEKLTTDAWFDYSVQKMTSISASIATAKFNELRLKRHNLIINNAVDELSKKLDKIQEPTVALGCEPIKINKVSKIDYPTLAYFDSRVFNIPKEEVSNYFLARQKDAVKNSVAMLAQSLYSHKELHKKNGSDMQEMCFQKSQNWNDLHWSKKRGSTVIKKVYINDIDIQAKDDKGNDRVVFFSDTQNYAIFDKSVGTSGGEWVDMVNPTIRSKWEVVETPMTFNEEYFKNFI